mmetsp:Transcript_32831/g.77627  ORF Transcript_32831/g.77627 Transcript_32831/m.77627 type:complete len:309 (-) Transcript_32831:208-1134(-)
MWQVLRPTKGAFRACLNARFCVQHRLSASVGQDARLLGPQGDRACHRRHKHHWACPHDRRGRRRRQQQQRRVASAGLVPSRVRRRRDARLRFPRLQSLRRTQERGLFDAIRRLRWWFDPFSSAPARRAIWRRAPLHNPGVLLGRWCPPHPQHRLRSPLGALWPQRRPARSQPEGGPHRCLLAERPYRVCTTRGHPQAEHTGGGRHAAPRAPHDLRLLAVHRLLLCWLPTQHLLPRRAQRAHVLQGRRTPHLGHQQLGRLHLSPRRLAHQRLRLPLSASRRLYAQLAPLWHQLRRGVLPRRAHGLPAPR